jgi:hypothetical protein
VIVTTSSADPHGGLNEVMVGAHFFASVVVAAAVNAPVLATLALAFWTAI